MTAKNKEINKLSSTSAPHLMSIWQNYASAKFHERNASEVLLTKKKEGVATITCFPH